MATKIEEHISVAVIAVPKLTLNAQQANELRKSIEGCLFEDIVSDTTDIFPEFRGFPTLRDGNLNIWCKDDFALNWLLKTVQNLTLWNGISFKVVRESELPKLTKATLWVPSAKRSAENLRRLLAKKNPLYDMNSWILHSCDRRKNPDGVFYMYGIPEVELKKVIKSKRRLKYGRGYVYLKISKSAEKAIKESYQFDDEETHIVPMKSNDLITENHVCSDLKDSSDKSIDSDSDSYKSCCSS